MIPVHNGVLQLLCEYRNPNFHGYLSGRIAQSVEQRTENPCVGGSIPSPATRTLSSGKSLFEGVFSFLELLWKALEFPTPSEFKLLEIFL